MVYLRVLFIFFIACRRGVKYCDFYFAPIEEAKYFDDRVCVFVYLSDLYQIFLCMCKTLSGSRRCPGRQRGRLPRI